MRPEIKRLFNEVIFCEGISPRKRIKLLHERLKDVYLILSNMNSSSEEGALEYGREFAECKSFIEVAVDDIKASLGVAIKKEKQIKIKCCDECPCYVEATNVGTLYCSITMNDEEFDFDDDKEVMKSCPLHNGNIVIQKDED